MGRRGEPVERRSTRHLLERFCDGAHCSSRQTVRDGWLMKVVSDAYRLSAEEVAVALDTDLRRGLTGEEAARRLAEFGRNELTADRAVPAWKHFLAQFRDVLVILLLVATAVSVA